MATRRIIDATPGGRPHKHIWAARAAMGHRFKPLGSLSSVATVGFMIEPHHAHGAGAPRPTNQQRDQRAQGRELLGNQKTHQSPPKSTLQHQRTGPIKNCGANPIRTTHRGQRTHQRKNAGEEDQKREPKNQIKDTKKSQNLSRRNQTRRGRRHPSTIWHAMHGMRPKNLA